MSPMINKTLEFNQDFQINIQNWKVNLDIEFNKPENAGIKEDFNKIKKNLDYSKMPVYSKDKLQEVIKNLKNRRKWVDFLSGYEDNKDLSRMLLQKMDDENNKSILTYFGVIKKNGRPVNQLPTFSKAIFNHIVEPDTTFKGYDSFKNKYDSIAKHFENFDKNQETYNQIKQECIQNTRKPGQYYGHIELTENFKADEYKIESLETWYPKIEELEQSDTYQNKIILNDIYQYINKSVEEDRKLINDAKEKHIPNAYPKNIIPFFDKELFDKALQMNGDEQIMHKYEKCYKDNIIQKYSLIYDEKNKATKNADGFYNLDLNKERKDTSEERHVNELQFISPNSWCTHSFEGWRHALGKHYYIILDKDKKVKFGGDYTTQDSFGYLRNRMESSTENNDQKFSLDMVIQILSLLKSQDVSIPFDAALHSDLRYILAKAIIKEKGIEHLKKEYESISTTYNLPKLNKDTLIDILSYSTKNYIEDDDVQISKDKFEKLLSGMGIEEKINDKNEEKLKYINIKRFFEEKYNPKSNTPNLSIDDINSKLIELGYSSIDITNEQERNETIDTIAKVVIDSDLLKRHNIDLNKVSEILQKVGLLEKEQNEEFLKNADTILKNYSFYIKNTINNIGSNRESSEKMKMSELETKLKNLGFISDSLENYIAKYASPMYFDLVFKKEIKIDLKEDEIIQEQNTYDYDNSDDDINIGFMRNFAYIDNDLPNPGDIEFLQFPGMEPIN